MKNIKKYRIVICTILLISLVLLESDIIRLSEGWSLVIRGINYVLLMAVSVWILVSPTKGKK